MRELICCSPFTAPFTAAKSYFCPDTEVPRRPTGKHPSQEIKLVLLTAYCHLFESCGAVNLEAAKSPLRSRGENEAILRYSETPEKERVLLIFESLLQLSLSRPLLFLWPFGYLPVLRKLVSVVFQPRETRDLARVGPSIAKPCVKTRIRGNRWGNSGNSV